MEYIVIFLLVTLALGLGRWILLSFTLKHPAPMFIFLIVNLLLMIMTVNSVGLALNFLIVFHLLVAIYFFLIPVETHTERKTTT